MRLTIILFSTFLSIAMYSQEATENRATAPVSYMEFSMNADSDEGILENDKSRGLTAPSLRVYLPEKEKATGRMVIALPGGGYQNLAVFHEGFDWAPYFLDKGIAFAVLKYRMPAGDPGIPFTDVKAAFDFVREHAAQWNIDPIDIGIMGSSAGGHLAATFATKTAKDDRPAFQILLYPVITMDLSFTHMGSRRNLLGEEPSPEEINLYSNEKQITKDTPRAFIIFAADDKAVPAKNGFHYAEALQEKEIPVTLLLYPEGGHGFGYRESFPYREQFLMELNNWLKNL